LQVSVLASGTLNALPEANMQTLTFENLYFSFLIDPATQTAYLQEWNDGEWSEADQFALPVPLATLDKKSRLARALRSFGDEGLRHAIGGDSAREPRRERRSILGALQACSRGVATRLADLIYAS
jgi:hypothetical protein